MTRTLLIILLSPLVAAALIALFGRKRGRLAAGISVLSAGVQAALMFQLLYGGWDGEPFHVTLPWLSFGGFELDMGFYLNPLSALLLFVVTFVGFCIHVFAIGYSDHDEARGRFFGGLSIFMFSMTGIVLSENLFMLFVFWELVGFSSYMLIGHYLTPEAAAASKKAFIVNRVGDFGFLLGILWCFWQFGTVSLMDLPGAVATIPAGAVTATGIGLLLFCGVLGKSAQMPLHVWLPDAMAGPTPVSALIHAATMVAAGVFLLGRIWFIFTPDALHVVLTVGLCTAAFAAFCAFGQDDIKKILAYSTLSQLGFMVSAFALGTLYGSGQLGEHGAAAGLFGVGAAHFHLTTHAFFKALMFLGAGSVIHACHHEQDIYKMGGLWKKMPITFLTFLVGVLAISGVPFLSGFYSKDAILLLAYRHSPVAFWVLAITSFFTAAYMARLFVVAFLGKPRSEHVEHAKESRIDMLLPLIALAVCAALGGYVSMYPEVLGHFIHANVQHPEVGRESSFMFILSCCLAGGGFLLAFLVYYRPSEDRDTLARRVPGLYALSKSKLWFDEIYGYYVKNIQQRAANMLSGLEAFFIQGLAVRGSGGVAGALGSLARGAHSGSLHSYVFWFAAGIILFWLFATGIF